jgi:hypothetical protein
VGKEERGVQAEQPVSSHRIWGYLWTATAAGGGRQDGSVVGPVPEPVPGQAAEGGPGGFVSVAVAH